MDVINLADFSTLWALIGAAAGGIGAYFAARQQIAVSLALVTKQADEARMSATDAHDRIDDHINRFHAR